MNIKHLTMYFILLVSTQVFCQSKVKIDHIKVKKLNNESNLYNGIKIKNNDLDKIEITFKIETSNNEIIDINKISLLDTINKFRFRPIDISYKIVGYVPFKELLKSDVKKKGIIGYHSLGATYKPEIKDSFTEFNFEGYQNVECPLNFWSEKDPTISVIYFQPIEKTKLKISLLFVTSNKFKKNKYDLYYGYQKLGNINL